MSPTFRPLTSVAKIGKQASYSISVVIWGQIKAARLNT